MPIVKDKVYKRLVFPIDNQIQLKNDREGLNEEKFTKVEEEETDALEVAKEKDEEGEEKESAESMIALFWLSSTKPKAF
jgi:hypothetical protein